MIGIYKIVNDINDKVYIGQSVNISRRFNQHLYDCSHLERCPKNDIHHKMIELGIEHFSFEVIEECSVDKLNEREIYWIDYYDSYHNGYNLIQGGRNHIGESHPRAVVNEALVWEIRECYNQHIPFRDAWKRYEGKIGIQKKGFKNIWKAQTWTHVHMDVYTPENKKWHKTYAAGHREDQIGLSPLDRALKQEEINQIYNDYKNGLSISDLVKKYNRDYGIIKKYINNPKETQKVQYKGKQVKNIETNIVFPSISKAAKWAGCGATTLTRHLYDNKSAGKVPETLEPAHWEEFII